MYKPLDKKDKQKLSLLENDNLAVTNEPNDLDLDHDNDSKDNEFSDNIENEKVIVRLRNIHKVSDFIHE